MDVLADLLRRSRAHGALFAHTTAHGRFGLAFGPDRSLAVHAVVDGEVWLVGAGEPRALAAGDVVLVRGDVGHGLASAPDAALRPMVEFAASSRVPGTSLRFRTGDDGPSATFLCGAFGFAGNLCGPLVDALPPVVHLRPATGSLLHGAVDLLGREMADDLVGQPVILDRLLDVLVVHALREHLSAGGDPPWFQAQADAQIGPALRLMHADPARGWTVAGLASEVGLSRAAFARRFTQVVGRPPLEYLTSWRMALAREALRETDAPLAVLAADVGYVSQFAFAAAFKRHHGSPPGRWRAVSRATAGHEQRAAGAVRAA